VIFSVAAAACSRKLSKFRLHKRPLRHIGPIRPIPGISVFGVYFPMISAPSILSCCLLLAATLSASKPQTGIEGVVTVGPVHGGPARIGVPDSRPLAGATFIAQKQNGTATSFTADDEGRFRVSLEPGHYTVSLEGKKSRIGRYGPFEVDVVAGQMTKVEWRCDTGMR
jgi:hypothetical protein